MTPTTYVDFWQEVTDHGRNPCWFLDKPDRIDWTRHTEEPELRVASLRECKFYLGIDACHLYPKQRLKRDGYPDEVIFDPRCAVTGCRWHHGLVDSGRLVILRKRLPAALEEWAKQYGLEDALDRQYGERLGV